MFGPRLSLQDSMYLKLHLLCVPSGRGQLQNLHITKPLEEKFPQAARDHRDNARLLAQMPASRVSRKPGVNNSQERKDAVSGRKDGNRGAGNTLARQQNRTERRSSAFGGMNNIKATAAIAWQMSPPCQQLVWRSHVLDGTDNMQLSSPPRRYIQEGKTAKVVTVTLSNL